MEGEKVLVHNQRGRNKWLTGTTIRRKSPVTYLVRMAQNTVRYCHANHLLHDAGSIQDDSESQQPDSVYVPEVVVASDEAVIEDTPVASSQDSISVPPRQTSRSAQPLNDL